MEKNLRSDSDHEQKAVEAQALHLSGYTSPCSVKLLNVECDIPECSELQIGSVHWHRLLTVKPGDYQVPRVAALQDQYTRIYNLIIPLINCLFFS